MPAAHPLTEFLIDWRPRRKSQQLADTLGRTVLPMVGFVFLVFGAYNYMAARAPVPNRQAAALLILGVALVWILPRFLRLGGNSFHPNLPLLFRRMSKDTALQLWLAPLTFRELLAIEAARSYVSHRAKFRAITSVICAYLLFMGFVIFYFCALRWDLSRIDYGVFFAGAFSVLAPLAAMADDMLIMNALHRYSSSFRRTLGVRDVSSSAETFDAMIPIAFFLSPAALGLLIPFLHQTNLAKWIWIAVIVVFGLLLTVIIRRVTPKWTQGRFDHFAAAGEAYYKTSLRRIAGE